MFTEEEFLVKRLVQPRPISDPQKVVRKRANTYPNPNTNSNIISINFTNNAEVFISCFSSIDGFDSSGVGTRVRNGSSPRRSFPGFFNTVRKF
jgi:hypothetical protein